MSSLYKRATPRQAQVLRMIEGAVKNTMHAHPGRVLDNYLARSIAKRAAGTISAAWPGLLALPLVASDRQSGQFTTRPANDAGMLPSASGVTLIDGQQRDPLVLIHKKLSTLANDAKRNGQVERYEAICNALRSVSVVIKRA